MYGLIQLEEADPVPIKRIARLLPLAHPALLTISWTIDVTVALPLSPPAPTLSSINVPVAVVLDLADMSVLLAANAAALSLA